MSSAFSKTIRPAPGWPIWCVNIAFPNRFPPLGVEVRRHGGLRSEAAAGTGERKHEAQEADGRDGARQVHAQGRAFENAVTRHGTSDSDYSRMLNWSPVSRRSWCQSLAHVSLYTQLGMQVRPRVPMVLRTPLNLTLRSWTSSEYFADC